MPADRARYVGEVLAMVVAETRGQAMDAAEAVALDLEPLAAVTKTTEASAPGAPNVWDEVPGNVFIETFFGDKAATEAAFAKADHVYRRTFDIGRVTGVPMEPRSALGVYDAATGRYTLYAGSGGAVRQKREMATVLNVEPEKIRVLSYDVGGNFGTRNRVYVEFPLVIWASGKVGRPVKWTAERSESFVSDYQGRDLVVDMELALDKDGNFLAVRSSNLSNCGARCVSLSPLSKGSGIVTGSYHIPAAYLRSRATFSHTPPTNAYRSSGRPEIIFCVERMVEEAAKEFGFDPIALRRRNLVRSDEMPYRNAVGMVYDSGEYERSLDMVTGLTDWDGFAARRREAKARGKLLGRGVAHYVESSIGSPIEQAQMRVLPDEGRVDLVIGTQPSGQGHETSFAPGSADLLAVPGETESMRRRFTQGRPYLLSLGTVEPRKNIPGLVAACELLWTRRRARRSGGEVINASHRFSQRIRPEAVVQKYFRGIEECHVRGSRADHAESDRGNESRGSVNPGIRHAADEAQCAVAVGIRRLLYPKPDE